MKISVIVPVYKVEKYIGKCIQSLLDQTYTNFEALIVDDGSPDRSIAIAKKMVGDDPRFIFLEKNNGGQASARNLALDKMTGQYVTFLDADDYLSSDCIFRMFTKILEEEADICLCNINAVDELDNVLWSEFQNISAYHDLQDIFLCLNTITAYPCGKLYRSDIFDNQRYPENIKTYEDTAFTFQTIYKKKIVQVGECLYQYVQRTNSTTKKLHESTIHDKKMILDIFSNFALKNQTSIDKDYQYFCKLKVYLYETLILCALYSNNYRRDVYELISELNTYDLPLDKTYVLKKFSKKIYLSILVIKRCPIFFKFLVKIRYALKKVYR